MAAGAGILIGKVDVLWKEMTATPCASRLKSGVHLSIYSVDTEVLKQLQRDAVLS